LKGKNGLHFLRTLHFEKRSYREKCKLTDEGCHNINQNFFVQSAWSLWIADLLIFADITDNILYTLAGKWHGEGIDLLSYMGNCKLNNQNCSNNKKT